MLNVETFSWNKKQEHLLLLYLSSIELESVRYFYMQISEFPIKHGLKNEENFYLHSRNSGKTFPHLSSGWWCHQGPKHQLVLGLVLSKFTRWLPQLQASDRTIFGWRTALLCLIGRETYPTISLADILHVPLDGIGPNCKGSQENSWYF